jgi:hypothetical protein
LTFVFPVRRGVLVGLSKSDSEAPKQEQEPGGNLHTCAPLIGAPGGFPAKQAALLAGGGSILRE